MDVGCSMKRPFFMIPISIILISSMRICPRHLFLALYFIGCVCMAACADRVYPPSLGEATESIEFAYRDDLARQLCQLSKGSFPNWVYYERFRDWLTHEEWHAMKRIYDAFDRRLTPRSRPLYLAQNRFLADNTTCELKLTKPLSGGDVEYVFMQTSPYIPFLPENSSAQKTGQSPEEAWYDLIVQYYEGETHSEIVSIVMTKEEDRWITRSNIEENYANPIDHRDAMTQFQTALEAGQFEEAEWLSLSLCHDRKGNDCAVYEDMIDGARESFRQIMAIAQKELVINDQKLTYVSYQNMAPYTSAKLSITNRGEHIIKNMVMRTHANPPQTCLLQNKRQQRTDNPSVIMPGETVTAYCALSENTHNFDRLTWFYFDADEAENQAVIMP